MECIFSLSKCMKRRWIGRWGKKWKVETIIFTSEKGFGFTRDLSTGSNSIEENTNEKNNYDKTQRKWKNKKKLGGWFIVLREEMELEFVKNAKK
jgi:hypothetical protein